MIRVKVRASKLSIISWSVGLSGSKSWTHMEWVVTATAVLTSSSILFFFSKNSLQLHVHVFWSMVEYAHVMLIHWLTFDLSRFRFWRPWKNGKISFGQKTWQLMDEHRTHSNSYCLYLSLLVWPCCGGFLQILTMTSKIVMLQSLPQGHKVSTTLSI